MVLFSEQCAFNNSVNSGNMKQRNSLTSNDKQTGRWPADMLDIYKLIYLIWPVWSLQQDRKISNEGPFFRFSWDRQKLLVALPRWRSLCHSLARDQPQPGSFFQRPREAEKRDPGNEVAFRLERRWESEETADQRPQRDSSEETFTSVPYRCVAVNCRNVVDLSKCIFVHNLFLWRLNNHFMKVQQAKWEPIQATVFQEYAVIETVN